MKKILPAILAVLFLITATGCQNSGNGSTPDTSGENTVESENTSSTPKAENYDVDLTKLSSTMVYSEVYNMMMTPDKYMGKKVKMSGNFGIYQDETTGKIYFACLIADATACCSQGIEFVLDGDYSYPDDYPEINSLITVSGTFDTYEEDGYTYCQLINAEME